VKRVSHGLRRVLTATGAMRSTLVIAGMTGLFGFAAVASQLAPFAAQTANAAPGPLIYRYQRGYYLDNGWLCYGWSSGEYHCTMHWHRAANGTLISDNYRWVPNYLSSGQATQSVSDPVSQPATQHTAAPSRPSNPPAAPSNPGAQGVINEIYSVFGSYGWQAVNVARCESGFNPNAVNPSSDAEGVFQFLAGTWAGTPYAGYSRQNAWANINAAHYVFVRDGYTWREWTCQP
jgi:hypothetical protein